MKNTQKILLTALLFLFCQFTLPAQQSGTIDSLVSLLNMGGQLHDTVRIKSLNKLAWELKSNKPDTAIVLSINALLLSKEIQWLKGESQSYHQLGSFNQMKGNYPVALDYNFKALKIRESLKDKKAMASTLGNIGTIYYYQGHFSEALNYMLKTLQIAESEGEQSYQAIIFNNIGNIYCSLLDNTKALEYYFKGLKKQEELKNKAGISNTLGNIGTVYLSQKNYKKALDFFFKALKLNKEQGDLFGISINLGNIGLVYAEQEDYSKALIYYFKALKLAEKIGNQNGIAGNLNSIGSVYKNTKKYGEAEKYLLRSLELCKSVGILEYISKVEKELSELYTQTNQPAKALEHYKKFIEARDSIFSEENTEKIVRSEMNFIFDKTQAVAKAEYQGEIEKQAALAEEKSRKQKIIIISIISGLLLVVLFAGILLRALRITKNQKQIIETKNNETEEQKKIITEKNKDITDSINYAKRIQKAILPHRNEIWKSFPQSFVLFKPKDIVSGDFYFFYKSDGRLEDNKEASSPPALNSSSIFLAAADCTGHGVPGAFMSLIGAEKLKEAVSQGTNLSDALKLLNNGIKSSLRQSEKPESTRDGMDIALVQINSQYSKNAAEDTITLHYAGANRPIWIIRKDQKQIEEIKATKKAIGGLTDDGQHFDNHQIKLKPGDSFYLFTDGFADLFGYNGKKLMTKKFKEILLDIQKLPMKEQGKYLEAFADNWRGKTEQIDDILVIGVRL